MGLFSRLGDIVNANINTMLDRAEDPEKIIALIVKEMEDTLVEVRASAVKTIAERKELERRLERIRAEAEDWGRKAEFALARDRDDLAKAALIAGKRAMQEADRLQAQLARLDEALAKQNEDVAALQQKLNDAKARREAMVARATTADNRVRVRAQIYDDRLSAALQRFEEAERHLDRMEGRVEAYDLGRDIKRGDSLIDELANLEEDAAVEEDLKQLKARLGRGDQNTQY